MDDKMTEEKAMAVGRPVPRFDAAAKVAGKEKYAADEYPENLLWAKAKRAGIPHGRIVCVDTAKAKAFPGVVAVLTAADVPGTNRQGIVHKDQPVIAGDKVRHCGDAVALVVAETRSAAAQAAALIEIDFDPLPAVFDPEEALKPDAPLVHDGGNTLLAANIKKGNPEEGFARSAVVVEGEFSVPFQEHAFLETENGVARKEADGRIVMTVSTQAPFRDRFEIAHALGLDMNDVRILSPFLGGAFGGKDGATVQCLLALAAMHAEGRPVKMWWDREESFLAGYKRHAVRMAYRLGADSDGTLRALSAKLYYDTGAYAHLGGEVMELGMEHAAGPYRIPNALIEGWCVYTNHPVAGAMRGFGVCQVSFAFERMMDRLAAKLGMDPLEMRLKNALRPGDTNCAGVKMIYSTGMVPCLEALREHPLWTKRSRWKGGAGLFKKRGVGIAAVFNAMGYGRGLPDAAIARIELTPEGKIRVLNGVSDMGQGNASTFVQIAGDILRQDAARMELVQPDTDRTLPSGSSSASRTTYTYGNALIGACDELKRRLFHWAALALLIDETKDFRIESGCVRHGPSGKSIPLEALARFMPEVERVCTNRCVMPVIQEVPDTGKAFRLGFPHAIFSYGAHVACVEVDELTGKADVLAYHAVTEGGGVINPRTFAQQVEGAVAQGLGYALMEDVQVRDGVIQNPDFFTYMIPTAMDVPDISTAIVPSDEPSGPFGMKGIGEVGVNAPLPAVAAAVEDAAGCSVDCAPLTAPRILERRSQSGKGEAR
jgi:CO/xanthine dehydrogenase Mo-binding subunit